MIHIELLNFFYAGLFVINKDFKVDIAKQIQVHLITVIPDGHHKGTILIKKADLFR
jgi:hypothetical protein